MSTIPKAAIEAAAKAAWEFNPDGITWATALDAISEEPLSASRENLAGMVAYARGEVEAAILAALPHLGEPVAWTTPGEIDRVRKHLTNKLITSTSPAWAATGVPLYLAPPAPAANPLMEQMAGTVEDLLDKFMPGIKDRLYSQRVALERAQAVLDAYKASKEEGK